MRQRRGATLLGFAKLWLPHSTAPVFIPATSLCTFFTRNYKAWLKITLIVDTFKSTTLGFLEFDHIH